MPTRLALRIQECFENLTPSERVLGSYILRNQHLVVGLSAAELARDAGTSKSTTVRFFRTLGYDGFDAVRAQARGELNRLQPGADAVAADLPPPPIGSPEAYLSSELTALAQTLEGFGSEALRSMVDRLATAERVWLAAFEFDAPLGPLAQSLLTVARAAVHLLGDGAMPSLDRLASFGPRDAVLMIALGGRTATTRFVVEQAQAAGCSLLVVTDLHRPSPPGSHAVVRCRAQTGGLEASVTAAVSVLQFLARQVAARIGKRARDRAALIDTLREMAAAK